MKDNNVQQNEIAVLGVPFDKNSSYRRGASLAPRRILESLYCESSNLWTENLIDLGDMMRWQFVGDIDFTKQGNDFAQIENEIAELMENNYRVVSLGGDHSITNPILRAFGKKYKKLNILQLDAHPDLYDELEGNRNSHASPFARIMEERIIERLVQVGIRTLTGHQDEQAKRFGVEIIAMKDIEGFSEIVLEGPVYLSVDMDCLDPAFAPGVSHHEPGGLSTREVLNIIQNFKGQLVGADIVEYNPERDIRGITGMVAAKLLKEIIGRLIMENEGGA